MSDVLYLYGFLPKGTAAPPEALKGIDGRTVEVLDLGSFDAAVSALDEAIYGEGKIESRLDDLAWVGRRGARHETVVTWLSDHGSIVPARLFTIFTSEEALRSEASARADAIRERLLRFHDLREWDLKVSYDRDVLAGHLPELSEEAARLEADLRTAAAGRRYLLERKREEVVRREVGAVAGSLARDLLQRLGDLAEEVRELEAPSSREDLPVVLNAALLVRVGDADELVRRASDTTSELEPKGLQASLTGPWAPYRFIAEEADV